MILPASPRALILLALDLATATGCCDGAVGGAPRLWSWYLADAGDGRPQRLLKLATFLRKYFAQEPCDGVVYEAPMPLGMMGESRPQPGEKRGKRIMMSEANVAFARGAVGVLEMTCAEHGKPVEAVSVQDARQCVLGWRTNRTGENTKARVVREVTKVHGVPAENDNECDSWVAWCYACALQNPRLALAHTPLFKHAG